MSTTPVFDPAQMLRDWLSKWETSVNDLANKNMSSPTFGQSMNQLTNLSLQMHRSFGELMGRYLSGLNLPTRTEIVELAAKLDRLESKLDRVAEAVQRLAKEDQPAPGQPAKLPRTRRPPAQPS